MTILFIEQGFRGKIMSEDKRKRIAIFSIGIILSILLMVTLSSYLSTNYILERGSGKNIDFTTHSEGLWDIWGINAIEEEYLIFDNYDDWASFINRTYRMINEDFMRFNESELDIIIEQQSRNLNFSEFVYFGAFFGTKPNTGYSIEVKDVLLEENQLKIYILKSEPDPFSYYGQAITHPHHAITMERDDIPDNATTSIKFLTENDVYLSLFITFVIISFILMIVIMMDKRSKKPKEDDQK
jgi:hypothetical protein